MARLYADFISGTITDAPLTAGATTVNAAILASVPEVVAPDIVALILDPEAAGNGPEIVHITAHTASATSATITRGQEGTSAVEHAAGTIVYHGLTADDGEQFQLHSTRFVLPWSAGMGECEVGTEAAAFRWIPGFACTLVAATPTAGTAPTGASINFDVSNDGTTMFSTKPTIAATAKDGTRQTPSVTAIGATDVVRVWITQIGSTLPGENVALALEIKVP